MDAIELGVLQACQELTRRKAEVVPLLAAHLDVDECELCYLWARRECPQHGSFEGEWRFFFHGYECDLQHTGDGRFLRIDFGPQGRTDTVTAWGVLQFIMCSCPPWSEYPELKAHFAKEGPPFHAHSGDLSKMSRVWDRLESARAFDVASKPLLELLARSTTVGADGIRLVKFPDDTPERTALDCMVAHRQRLSKRGMELLDAALVELRH